MRWLVLLLLVSAAAADFGGSDGFSGKNGITCDACHRAAPVAQAQVVVEGFPEAYDYDATYSLTVRIEGGPVANPLPFSPRGGFDLEVSAGTVAGDPALTRNPSPQEITYTPDGTLMREWTIDWVAPTNGTPAVGVNWWVAVVAANGNHVIGQDDTQGETGDATADRAGLVRPSADTEALWLATPVPPPVLGQPMLVDGLLRVQGSVDPMVDRAAARVDGGPWQDVSVPEFTVIVPPDAQRVEAVAWAGGGRLSESTILQVAPEEQASGVPLIALIAGLGLVAGLRRSLHSNQVKLK